MIAAAKAIRYSRARFDRCELSRVQPQPIRWWYCSAPGGRAPRIRVICERSLDLHARTRQVTQLFCDMKVCHITGSRAARGSVIHRRGLAKKKGGVGRHITKMVPRIFAPRSEEHTSELQSR